MSRALQIFLIICYGLAWLWSSSKPVAGFLFLAAIGTLISLPTIFKNVLAGMLISALLGVMVAAFPCLAPLLGIWLLINILAKIGEIIENFMLLVVSFVLYAVLLLLPLPVRIHVETSIIDANSAMMVNAIMFGIGTLIMQVTCHIFKQFGRKSSKTAAFIVGLPGFLIMLVIFLFSLHDGGDAADASGDNDGQY